MWRMIQKRNLNFFTLLLLAVLVAIVGALLSDLGDLVLRKWAIGTFLRVTSWLRNNGWINLVRWFAFAWGLIPDFLVYPPIAFVIRAAAASRRDATFSILGLATTGVLAGWVIATIRLERMGIGDVLSSNLGLALRVYSWEYGAVLILSGLGFLGYEWMRSQRDISKDSHACVHCGYDLRKTVDPRCPECGTPFDPDERRHVCVDSKW